MNRIAEYLSDPGWWFTAVFVAVLASLAAAFLKDAVLASLAKVSKYYRDRKKEQDEEVEKQLKLFLSDSTLFLLSFCRVIMQTSVFLTFFLIFSVMYGFYISLPQDANIRIKVFLGSLTIMGGVATTYSMFKVLPKVKVIKTAHKRYQNRVIAGVPQQSAPGDFKSLADTASSETREQ